jgi:hypothetical protein
MAGLKRDAAAFRTLTTQFMTTSRQTDWMNHPTLRRMVNEANEQLTLSERMTLVKALVPAIADKLDAAGFSAFVEEFRLKGERFLEAKTHPGAGRSTRKTPGERELEDR